ncbi:MAG: CocE/NonD family hydrolase [Gemmatimonadales bacterium]
MRRVGARLVVLAALASLTPLVARAQTDRYARPPATSRFTVQKNISVPMRDGVELAADVYLPTAGGRFPVIVMRTPYDKNGLAGENGAARYFAGQGYAVVAQDVRGRYESDGQYTVQSNDREDGFDTIEWAARQPWSTGKVGTYGCSYLGETQVLLAGARHPNHLAAVPQAAAGGLGSGGGYWSAFGAYESGVYSLSSAFGWFLNAGAKDKGARPPADVDYAAALRHLPVVEMIERVGGPRTDFEDFVRNRPGSDYWSTQGYASDTTRFDVPALHVNSWLDYGAEQTLYLFELFAKNGVGRSARENQFVIISPTTHCGSEGATEHTVVGELDVGDARLEYWRIYRDWFDHWLKGIDNRVLDRPKVQYYVMHDGWHTARSWPVPEIRTVPFYLSSTRGANTASGDGLLATTRPQAAGRDTLSYDPGDPFPSRGGTICCTGNPEDQPGIFDQSANEGRPDLLVYTGAALPAGLTIAGPVRVELFVSSDAVDTDFTAKLIDVDPDGRAWNVVDGVARVRYRDGLTQPALMEPGQTYRVVVNLKSTGYRFRPGHRIRLYLTSSNFPQYERNTNTGGNIFDESDFFVARNAVHFGGSEASALILPVLRSP